MPGQRDCVSEVKDGVRQLSQKRLMSMSIREVYRYFKETHANVQISFSSFAALRPKHCKLLGTSGSHNVCVCTMHENVDLMITALKKLRISHDRSSYTDQFLCCAEIRTHNCFLRTCTDCCDFTTFEAGLLEKLEEQSVEEISFEQWLFTDRCNIEAKTMTPEPFASFFAEKLNKFVYHDFIKNQQANFLKMRKETLAEGEILAILDFAENYSFVLQNEVQAFHWNNSQCTIHPFVVYFKENGSLKNISFVIISEV